MAIPKEEIKQTGGGFEELTDFVLASAALPPSPPPSPEADARAASGRGPQLRTSAGGAHQGRLRRRRWFASILGKRLRTRQQKASLGFEMLGGAMPENAMDIVFGM